MESLTTTTIMQPIVQFGFAGLSIVLLGILVWLIRELLAVLKENNKVIATNTAAITAVDKNTKDTKDLTIQLKDKLDQRPLYCPIRGAEK